MAKVYQLKNLSQKDYQKVGQDLKSGHIAVMPSDTIYGIYTSALKPTAVEKIFDLRRREKDKPFIILISKINQLKLFGINPSNNLTKFLKANWPNPLSIIFDCPDQKFEYLHRGLNSLAIRFPKNQFLQKVIDISGPLVAPSANIAGEKPAENLTEAQKYFGEAVSFYVDAGQISGSPSTIIKIEAGKIKILRPGAYNISDLTLDS